MRQALQGAVVGLGATVATYLGLCVAALALYDAVAPPVTGVQLQRWVEDAWSSRGVAHRQAWRPLDAMAPSLPQAVVAAEDSRFFHHYGVDWKSVETAVAEYRQGDDLRGASTITQQLVKNLFLTTHSTWLRKILEVPLAYAEEGLLSKARILELYLNVVEWGPGVYGAESAARHYYGQPSRSLAQGQPAALAACLPNPRVRHPRAMDWYRRIILRRMSNLGPLPLPTED